jgi:hypothetical protein
VDEPTSLPATHLRRSTALQLALAIALLASAPDAADAAQPIGYLDAADCERIAGWSQDPDEPDKPIDVHVYIGGPAGTQGAAVFGTNAGIHRDDLCTAIGSCAHGFAVLSPLSLHDGQPRDVYAYGIDSQGGNNPLLGSAPKTLSCGAGAPAGIKRKVDGVGTFDAWRFSSFWDLLPLGAAEADALTEGPALSETPELVKADDGAPGVWLVDGALRRAVSDAVAATWRLDPASAVALPAAELAALVEGTPLRARPVIFIQGGLYMIDDPQPEPPGSSASSASGAGGGGSATGAGAGVGGGAGGGDADPAEPDGPSLADDGSCSLRSAQRGGWWPMVIAALVTALGVRRRRRGGTLAAPCVPSDATS